MTGSCRSLRRVLSDPSATVIVVEHRDRLARFGVEHLDAVLAARGAAGAGRRSDETGDDLVRDIIEVVISMCACLCGRRGGWNRAFHAVTAAENADVDAAA
jgi:putative resolvase